MTLRGILLAIFLFLLVRAVRKLMAKAEPKRLAKRRAPRALPKPPPPEPPRVDGELAHEILGVDADAPIDEVRGAYQRLMREHHPDKAASLGAEEQARAEANAKRLNRAYEALKERG